MRGTLLSHTLSSHWRRYFVGNGVLEQGSSNVRLVLQGASTHQYSDAQLDDYSIISRQHFLWRPPLRMVVRARFSHPSGVFKGTAGFGFWNYPFLLPNTRLPTLPQTIWFFYASPPSNMKLDLHTPGYGWKAATLDTRRATAVSLVPLAPLVVPLMNNRTLYHILWSWLQRILHIREALLPVEMTAWHIYTIDWGRTSSRFLVDGQPVLENAPSPSGPLCCVLWVDNQCMVVTPWGKCRWGLLDIAIQQWMEVEWCVITPELR